MTHPGRMVSHQSASSCLHVCLCGGCCLFVLETIRTGAMRAVHISVKTEETQRLRIKFVQYCPIYAFNLKIKRANF